MIKRGEDWEGFGLVFRGSGGDRGKRQGGESGKGQETDTGPVDSRVFTWNDERIFRENLERGRTPPGVRRA